MPPLLPPGGVLVTVVVPGSNAQALTLAGSRSVCLRLWKVNDAATALLMERFYQNLLGKREGLKAPLPNAAALAEAKEWLRKLPPAEALKRAASLSKGVERGLRPKLPPLEVPPAQRNPAADRHGRVRSAKAGRCTECNWL